MDAYDNLPDAEIKPLGEISRKFIELGIKSFKEACIYVHDSDYGYNSNYDDKMIFFKEKMASCTMKHATIAGLAEELDIPLYKYIGATACSSSTRVFAPRVKSSWTASTSSTPKYRP